MRLWRIGPFGFAAWLVAGGPGPVVPANTVMGADSAIVDGVVSDSTTGAPLGGVRVTIAGAPAATTDSSGSYRVATASSGEVAIRFVHPAFPLLGVDDVVRTVRLTAGRQTKLDVGIPLFASAHEMACPSAPADLGIVLGRLLDPAGKPVAGAMIRVGLLPDVQRRETDQMGYFSACGLPIGLPVPVGTEADSTGVVVMIPPVRVTLVQLVARRRSTAAVVVDTARKAADSTTGIVTGRVTDFDGRAVTIVQVALDNREARFHRDMLVTEGGTYTFRDVPAGGPYIVTVRRLGFDPATKTDLVVEPGRVLAVNFRLSEVPTTVAEIEVRAGGSAQTRLGITREEIAKQPVPTAFAVLQKMRPGLLKELCGSSDEAECRWRLCLRKYEPEKPANVEAECRPLMPQQLRGSAASNRRPGWSKADESTNRVKANPNSKGCPPVYKVFYNEVRIDHVGQALDEVLETIRADELDELRYIACDDLDEKPERRNALWIWGRRDSAPKKQ